MQKEVDIDSKRALEKVHELGIVELGLQQIVQRDLGIGARNHHVPAAPVDGEDADFIARDGQVDPIPLPLQVALPVHQDALVGQVACRVLVAAELEGAAAALQFAFVIPLFGEGHDESFFALLALKRHHGLLDVVIVCLQLLLQIYRLLVEPGQGGAHTFQFTLPLDSSSMFGPDVNCDYVQQILVMVPSSQFSNAF